MPDAMEKLKLLLKAPEAAEALGVSQRTLWSLTFQADPGLPYVRLGRSVRYRPEDLKDFLAKQVHVHSEAP